MDSVLENVMRRRDELERELADIRQFIQLYQRFSDSKISPHATGAAVIRAGSVPTRLTTAGAQTLEQMWGGGETKTENQPRPTPSMATKSLSREQLRPHIEAVIREAGKPLTRGNLLKKLDQRGTPVGGEADRAKNMGTIMWRLKDQFVNLPGYGYWIKSEPYALAEYDPSGDSDFDL